VFGVWSQDASSRPFQADGGLGRFVGGTGWPARLARHAKLFFSMPSDVWVEFVAAAYVVEVLAVSLFALVARKLADGLEFIVYCFAFLVPVLLICDWLYH
jgi:hypothetical protein